MANGEWYYARGNQQQGPVALQAIQDMLRSGQLQPHELVWKQGMPNWLAASQVPELVAGMGAPAPQQQPVSPYAPPQQQYPQPGQYAPQPGAPSPYSQPGYYSAQQPYPVQAVPNYLVAAILTTIFCCLPFGIVSIVYAAQVNSKLAAGDYAGALDSSQKAKTWAWWSAGITVIGIGAYILFVILGVAMDQR